MIEFSRHAKRRMQLYGISEEDVFEVLSQGQRETLANGKIVFVYDFERKFSYPIKVVGFQTGGETLIITTYPVKKRKRPV
jgi:hypothetical protein